MNIDNILLAHFDKIMIPVISGSRIFFTERFIWIYDNSFQMLICYICMRDICLCYESSLCQQSISRKNTFCMCENIVLSANSSRFIFVVFIFICLSLFCVCIFYNFATFKSIMWQDARVHWKWQKITRRQNIKKAGFEKVNDNVWRWT